MEGFKVAVLIIFFNKLEETKECIKSFLPAGHPIYVLNNCSSPIQWSELQAAFGQHKQIIFLSSKVNLGPAGGRNNLIKSCKETWLLIVDNDTEMQQVQDWPQRLHKHTSNRPSIDAFSLRVYNVHENEYVSPIEIKKVGRKVEMLPSTREVTNCFANTGILVNRSLFDKFGLFDENLFVFEDFEFGLRSLLSTGKELQVLHINDVELKHTHRLQINPADKQAVKKRYNEQKITNSINHLEKKYGVEFDHHWEWWARKQVADMTRNSFADKIKSRFTRGISRFLGR